VQVVISNLLLEHVLPVKVHQLQKLVHLLLFQQHVLMDTQFSLQQLYVQHVLLEFKLVLQLLQDLQQLACLDSIKQEQIIVNRVELIQLPRLVYLFHDLGRLVIH
jgi:hypothetical protein